MADAPVNPLRESLLDDTAGVPAVSSVERAASPSASRMGEMDIVIASMFCGKSSYLAEKVHEELRQDHCVLVLNPKTNTRDKYLGIETHDGHRTMEHPKLKYLSLALVPRASDYFLRDADAIVIEEAQFWSAPNEQGAFPLRDFCMELRRQGKNVYLAALPSTFDLQPWPGVAELIAVASNVKFKRGVCKVCKRPRVGCYSRALVDITPGSVVIGSDDKYALNCAQCFFVGK